MSSFTFLKWFIFSQLYVFGPNTDDVFRIIEIAGGREIYSQSRSKAVRKSRNNGDEDKKKQKSPLKQGVWELRGHCNDSKKLKNSREFTETVFSSEVCSVTHQQLDQQNASENESKVPESTDMTFAGEVVVFDDIDDSWHDEDPKRMESNHENTSLNLTSTNLFETNEEECERVTKVIGSLPIAVYEGSPRRYGMRHVENNCTHPQLPSAQSLLASPSVYPPRPGFPQRIVCTPSENVPCAGTENSSFSVSTVK